MYTSDYLEKYCSEQRSGAQAANRIRLFDTTLLSTDSLLTLFEPVVLRDTRSVYSKHLYHLLNLCQYRRDRYRGYMQYNVSFLSDTSR